ncbi:patatin-like phospholipase family protein [Thioalkalivibrio sp. XN279]|uniref:patatin-like phospholipase family protein n=1 Tax=Thioalkalivibrio sp. XN279 TaxID=2714953 RepID=UPI00140C24FD|nr:patatin-like phospholipase family protein [Thioalkalivibrio sp. XN279]NHA13643.1 patatin-like phospholipase family protein [Thioalkalivibrio sp. XN279]
MQAERARAGLGALCAVVLLNLAFAAPVQALDARQARAPSIGLALGSGGAGGLAHIAMLGVFDELGLKPAAIAGTSIGAVMGALYAGGLDAAEIRAVFEEFGGSRLDMLSGLLEADVGDGIAGLLQTDLINGAVLDIDGFLEFLGGKIEARTFAELDIELAVVATDYWSGEMRVIREGELFPALAASMAVPGLFAPVQRGDDLLIDGGTSNPLPFDLLQGRYDVVVAVDVSGSRRRGDAQEPGMLDVLFKSFEIMQGSLISQRLADHSPDIYIKVDTSGVRLLDFNRIDEVLRQARPAAEELRRKLDAHKSPESSP